MLQPLSTDDPDRVGPYRLQSRIGAGGMGTVYLGFTADNKPVAVKVPSPGLADDPEFRNRFRTEVAAAQRVRGGSVATVLDADVDGPRPWMATEYVEGRSLTEAVAQRGPFTGRLLDGLAVGLADALVAIHAAGVVHRDLKPSNILVTWDGPKVIDFGIARAVDSANHTRTGTLIGTLIWMAPEQLRGERAGPPADIFAWGACTVFAATGRQPFRGDRPQAIAIQIMSAEPDLTDVPSALAAVLARALDKDPARRPAAAQLVAQLVGHDVADAGESDRAAETALARWWSLSPTPPQPQSPAPAPSGVHGGTGGYDRTGGYDDLHGRRPADRGRDAYTRDAYLTQAAAQHPMPAPDRVRDEPDRAPTPPRPRRRGTLTAVLAAVLAVAVLGGVVTAMALRNRDSLLTGRGSTGSSADLAVAAQTGTPTARRSSTASPTPSVRSAASASGTPRTSPSVSPTSGYLTLAEAKNTVNQSGYTVIDSAGFVQGRTLNVLIGKDAGSPTPREFGFFFVGTEMIGKDFSEPSAGIRFVSATQNTVVLRYDLYEPSDKVCCPSGGTADLTFRWNGTKLGVDQATIPPTDPNAHHSRR
ncbi:protein kinase [Frankia sp. Cppng1_Ct_nod]|uniref:protein kinase domain-containing protein n=1 Tax=Frankia sp. Cppng1_Ct_nod TaxID=2897162 RepID=UPI0010413A59|nr:protein kinase [Frankia sp. Cppng1_Ct_nod]